MVEIDSYKSFEDNIINSSDLIVLDIYKTNCGQCKMMMPLIDKLSKKYNEEVSFYKVNLDVVPEVAVAKLQQLKADCEQFLTTYRKPQSYMAYWTRGFDRDETKRLSAEVEKTVTYLENSTQVLVVNKLMDMPILRQLFTYCPSRGNKKIGIAAICLFPIGLAGYFIGSMHQKHFKRDIKLVIKVSDELTALVKDSKDAIEDKSKD